MKGTAGILSELDHLLSSMTSKGCSPSKEQQLLGITSQLGPQAETMRRIAEDTDAETLVGWAVVIEGLKNGHLASSGERALQEVQQTVASLAAQAAVDV